MVSVSDSFVDSNYYVTTYSTPTGISSPSVENTLATHVNQPTSIAVVSSQQEGDSLHRQGAQSLFHLRDRTLPTNTDAS